MAEPQYAVWFDSVKWQVLCPHLQAKNGGVESVVARLFCHRSFAMEMTPDMVKKLYTEYELRILANVARHKNRRH